MTGGVVHETKVPPPDQFGPATCDCGWQSDAEMSHVLRLGRADAHMHEHYAVFVQAVEDDGSIWSGWGTAADLTGRWGR